MKKYTDAKNDHPTVDDLKKSVNEFIKNEIEKKEGIETKTEVDEKTEQKEFINDQTEEKKEKIKDTDSESEVDYKKKFVESSKEALILHSRNKQIREAVENASKIPEPSEEEMRKIYGEDWDLMTDAERRLVIDNYVNKKRFEILQQAITAGKDLEEWISKVEKFSSDPKVLNQYPELEGKQGEFVEFASKPTRRGLPLEDVVAAFLFNYEKTMKKPQGKMFEIGSAGPNERQSFRKLDRLTPDELARLRKIDYRKYREYLKSHRVDFDSI